jgi:hypothetical protein
LPGLGLPRCILVACLILTPQPLLLGFLRRLIGRPRLRRRVAILKICLV